MIAVEEAQAVYGELAVESERLKTQIAIDGGKDDGDRNKLGQVSTPYVLAQMMMTQAVGLLPIDLPVRFVEPAVGTGGIFIRFGGVSGIECAA